MAQYYFFSGILQIGKEFELRGEKVSYLRKEKKPKLKEQLYFQDKNQQKYLCKITKLKSRFIKFLVVEKKEVVKKKFFLDLYLPILPKKDLQTFLFQATEMGVSGFYFFESEYSRKISVIDEKKKPFWEQIICNACENSGEYYFPSIFFSGKLQKTVQNLREQNASFCVLHPTKIVSKKLVVKHHKLAVFVGPKKGFSSQELEMMNCPQISLGKNWLKPQTAALSSLAIFQYLFGNFHFHN